MAHEYLNSLSIYLSLIIYDGLNMALVDLTENFILSLCAINQLVYL